MSDVAGPSDNAKRMQILDGARAVFLAQGFAAASMGEIARAAKVSKGTLYVYFDSKEALFRELIAQRRRLTAERLTEFDPGDHDVETALTRFATQFIDALTEPDHVALVRMVVGAAEAFPDLGREFYDAGPAFGAERLRAYLAAQAADGVLAIEDPHMAAWHFLGMCKEPAMIAMVLRAAPKPEPDAIQRQAAAAARAFVRAYAP